MGLQEELELVKQLQAYGMNCVHRLKQKKITDFLKENDNQSARSWLQKNKSLPREKFTYEVDILAWHPEHWGALAIEQKTQMTQKTLCVGDDFTMHNGAIELQRGARDLFLQCRGSGYLGQAYCDAFSLNKKVIPVGVVDYDINIGGANANWAYHNEVFFVKTTYFKEFLNEFLADADWIKQLVNLCN